MLSDVTMLAVLSLYKGGWQPDDIDDAMNLSPGAAAQVIADDAAEFPNEPLRVLQ